MVSWLLKKSDLDSREMSWLTWLPITISAAKPYERFCDTSVWGPRGGCEKCSHTVIFSAQRHVFTFAQAFSLFWMCSVSVSPLKILTGMCYIAKLQAPTFPGSFSSFSLWSEPWNAVFFGQCNLEDCRGRGWSWFRWWWLRLENDRFAGSMESPESSAFLEDLEIQTNSDQDDKRRRWLWICSRKIHVIRCNEYFAKQFTIEISYCKECQEGPPKTTILQGQLHDLAIRSQFKSKNAASMHFTGTSIYFPNLPKSEWSCRVSWC